MICEKKPKELKTESVYKYDQELFSLGAYGCGILGFLVNRLICMKHKKQDINVLSRNKNLKWFKL